MMKSNDIPASPLATFLEETKRLTAPIVLELGTRRIAESPSTRREHWVPHAVKYVGVDFIAGEDVDVVADIHTLSSVVGHESCDVIISCSTLEHVKYPHLAAHEMMKALRVGGQLFIQTHQTFPLHSYPYDYFRFSREGLAGLFGTKMGFEVIATQYEFPAEIHSPWDPQLNQCESFLNVVLFGRKASATPAEYIYELQ